MNALLLLGSLLSPIHWMVLAIVCLVLLNPQWLPPAARTVGQLIRRLGGPASRRRCSQATIMRRPMLRFEPSRSGSQSPASPMGRFVCIGFVAAIAVLSWWLLHHR